jgi:3-methyladenine DNA glycosylase AlkD
MISYHQVMERLTDAGRPDQLEGMSRFGIVTDNRLGVSMPVIRALGKQIGKDHQLALQLWESGIQDAKILASLVDDPRQVNESQMDAWVTEIDSWDVCDQLCMNLFDKTRFVRRKIDEWAEREEEFVKRSAYSLIASLAVHDKKARDDVFLEFLPVIERGSTDERNYVKKAVSWALRHVGKRNLNLNRAALETARKMRSRESRASRWIGAQAVRELESDAVQRRLRRKAGTL